MRSVPSLSGTRARPSLPRSGTGLESYKSESRKTRTEAMASRMMGT